MKTKFKIYTAFIAVCTVLLVLTGCYEMADLSIPGGGGKLILSINASASRTIQPESDIEFTSYDLEFLDTANGDAVVEFLSRTINPDVTSIIGIEVGTYKLRVTAKTGNLLPTAEGTSDPFTISNSTAATASVTLLPIAEQKGTFAWNITLEHGIEDAVVSLTVGDDDPITLVAEHPEADELLLHGGHKLYDSGRYNVLFTLVKDGKTVIWPELLDIYPHMTSQFDHTFHSALFTKELITVVIEAIKSNNLNEIVTAHFGATLLDIDVGADFALIRTDIFNLYSVATNPTLANVADLKVLIDAALVKHSLAANYENQEAAETAVGGLIKNGSTPAYALSGETLTITIGDYTITTHIPVVDCCTGLNEVCLHEAGKAIVKNPRLDTNEGQGSAQSTWSGTHVTPNAVTNWTGGAVRYAFPADTTEFKIANYDFFELQYESAATGQVILKQLTTGTDYGFVTEQYPTLTATGSLNLQIRGAGISGGVALKRNNGTISFKLNRVVFTPGVRHTVSFDLGAGYGGSTSPYPDMTVVETFTLGTLPVPTWDGYNFMGWKLGDTTVNAATVVTSAFANGTLVAQWQEVVPNYLPKLPIILNAASFTNSDVVGSGGTVTLHEATGQNGVNLAASGYDSYVAIKVTLPSEANLSDYKSISLKTQGTAGGSDLNYKKLRIFAGTSSSGLRSDANIIMDGVTGINTGDNNITGNGASEIDWTINIDQAKAVNLSGVIWLGFCVHNINTGAAYNFYNIVLNPHFLEGAEGPVDYEIPAGEMQSKLRKYGNQGDANITISGNTIAISASTSSMSFGFTFPGLINDHPLASYDRVKVTFTVDEFAVGTGDGNAVELLSKNGPDSWTSVNRIGDGANLDSLWIGNTVGNSNNFTFNLSDLTANNGIGFQINHKNTDMTWKISMKVEFLVPAP